MTRIFEALKKAQGRTGAMPFPPAAETPPRAAVMPRPAATPAGPEPGIAPGFDVVPTTPLPDEVVREMTALRIGLESALEARTTRIVMFLGSMSGEGATTIATHFACALAADGRGRTLLLDARGPRGRVVHAGPRAVVPVRDAHALSPARRGGQPLSVASVNDEIRRAGGRAQVAVRTFLAGLATQFDWVVVDGPPVLDAPDTVDLAPLVDGVVLVIRAGYTKRPVVVRAVDLLRKSGAHVLGSVLNRRRFEIPDFIYRRV